MFKPIDDSFRESQAAFVGLREVGVTLSVAKGATLDMVPFTAFRVTRRRKIGSSPACVDSAWM